MLHIYQLFKDKAYVLISAMNQDHSANRVKVQDPGCHPRQSCYSLDAIHLKHK